MKIAILTQPLHRNYGGILQAYALQTFLQRNGHEVIVINRDYDFKLSLKLIFRRLGSVIKSFIRLALLGKREYCIMNPFSPFYHVKWSGYNVLPFVSKYICQSKEIRSSKDLNSYFRKHKFDCYVVGSDQVWRPCYSPCITDFFLKEIPSDDKAIKVAYAASFGTDQWEFTEEETAECSSLAKLFDAISVREASGVDLCKDYLGVDAQHLLDPTMLLNKEDYISLFEKADMSNSEGDMFCYILDESVEAKQIIETLEKDGYNPHYANLYTRSEKNNPRPYQLSVEEWLQGIYDSKVVVTDSFHACVFAIIFGKPFIACNNIGRGTSRLESLLEQFNLQRRLIHSYKDFMLKKMELISGLDIKNQQEKIQLWREKSESFFAIWE